MTRHVLVSGGTRGLGMALVEDLLVRGYAVSTFGRSRTAFVDATAEAHPDRFFFTQGDLSDDDDVARVVKECLGALGTPWGLVNNAGIAVDGVLAAFPTDRIEQVLDINLKGTLVLTRHVVRRMILEREGRVITISSIIGQRGYRGLAVYGATKAGLDGMTRALARELGERGITVNSVAPGYLETEMTHGLDDAQRGQITRRTPMGRLGTPADVTGPVAFLLSDEASFVTGQVLTIDGGITC